MRALYDTYLLDLSIKMPEEVQPIPTVPAWDVISLDAVGDVKGWRRFLVKDEAVHHLEELNASANKGLTHAIKETRSIVPDRTRPTAQQVIALCKLMQDAFVAIRLLAWRQKHEAVEELADTFHNLPVEMFRENVWDWNSLEYAFRNYEEKHPQEFTFNFARKLRDIRANP